MFDFLQIFLKLLMSTCLHFNADLKFVWKEFEFAPSFGDKEAIIPSVLTLIWKKKKKKKKFKIHLPIPTLKNKK